MGKFFLKILSLLFLIIIFSLVFLSYFGLETGKFDVLIKNKANTVNKNIRLEFNKTKIYLNIKELKVIVKLQKPVVLLRNNEIDLSKLDLFLSLKSYYKSDFILEKAKIAFEKNDINDLSKLTNLFLPRIINKKIKKIFLKGNLEGEFVLPFKQDGSISSDYKFSGKINNADINLSKDYKIKNLTAKVGYGKNNSENIKSLKIIIEKGSISNLKLADSFIDIKFEKNKKVIQSTIHTVGNINFSEVKKIASLLNLKIEHLEDFNSNSDLKTNVKFNIDKGFKIKNVSYSTKGNINSLQLKITKGKEIKNFLPSFNKEISVKNAILNFSKSEKKQLLKLEGNVKISESFEKLKISQTYTKKNKMYNINVSSSLNESLVKVEKLNYQKVPGINANINFDLELVDNKYFLIKSLSYLENKNEIILEQIKLNSDLEISDISRIKILTYLDNLKNNDFTINKKDKIKVSGDTFDAQPLLKSLFKNNTKKTFSKNFNSDIKINFKKVTTGTDDDVADLGVIASIKSGSYNKLSLKGNFSKNEIVEMSIYQVNEEKKTLQVISDRARPFIKHFDFIEGFEGGKLEYESTIFKSNSTSNLVLSDFKVSKVPALAKLLTLASLQGIADTLSGEGIRFESFEMKSNTKNNVLNIEDALAMGPAVSILLDGYVDKGKVVSLRGTLVPATQLNSIISKIPIVGDILVGKKTGEGVVGVSFRMKGPPKKIKTTVNPIKTLTPRFIVRAIEKLKKQNKDKTK